MYLLTATLLNSWHYLLSNEYSSEEDFMKTLRREPLETTEAMLKGRAFEDWAYENIAEFKGAQLQLKCSKEDGETLFYGVLDAFKDGVVTDAKYTGSYEVGKFRENYQTPMYLYLSGAYKMQYLISTKEQPKGHEIYFETYYPHEVEPIQAARDRFYKWLESSRLWDIYTKHWLAKSKKH